LKSIPAAKHSPQPLTEKRQDLSHLGFDNELAVESQSLNLSPTDGIVDALRRQKAEPAL
jgi:hypothetical protein